MTVSAEEVRRRNREAQRRRRAKPEAREVDRAYDRSKGEGANYWDRFKAAARRERRNPETWARAILRNIKSRAKSRGIEFCLTPSDLTLPTHCPVLGIPLVVGAAESGPACPNSPSVDRLDNSKGYTPENVRVISNRANMLKKDATTAEVRALLAYMEGEGAP